MDRDDLVTFVKNKLRIPDQGEGLLTDARLVLFVNEALRHFCRERDWPWLLTSATVNVATTGLGTLPTGYKAARFLTQSGNPVTYVGIDELLAGTNRYVWTDDGVSLRVEPAPTATTAFTLHYYRIEPDLDDGDSSPIAPSLYHDAIGLWAAHLAALTRRDSEFAMQLEHEYNREIDRIASVAFRKRGQTVRVTARGELGTPRATW